MLTRLYIQNYAIIEEIHMDLSSGFSVITGETGAGKSILIGALGLVLGQRADASVLGHKEKKLVVEAQFDIRDKKAVQQLLQQEQLEQDEELIIRREIAAAGKSRAFVNDTPVNLSLLQQLSSLLVDLHQQFDTLELSESEFQREVLDALAGQLPLLEQYRVVYQALQEARQSLSSLQEQKKRFDAQLDYDRYQLEELQAAAFLPGEIESIEAELKTLHHAESIRDTLLQSSAALLQGEQPLLSSLKSLINQLTAQQHFYTELPALEQRFRSAYLELEDVARELDRLSDRVQAQPERLLQLNERLSMAHRLCKKHQVTTTESLLDLQEQLTQKVQAVLDMDQTIARCLEERDEKEKQATELAAQLSAARHRQKTILQKKVNALLLQVGMPAALLSVAVTESALGPDGSDRVEFLFDANRSGQFQPLRKVASGGELSRLMLCIKSLVAASLDLPTLIFDEIDTGIAGEAARQVGLLLHQLAANRQVICITHQPQIAAKAQSHFFVYKDLKKDAGTAASTHIRLLIPEERVTIIAQLLGGESPSAAALANAREMLS